MLNTGKIKGLLAEKGLTQNDLAKAIEKSPPQTSAILKNGNCDLIIFSKIVKFLNVEPQILLKK